MPPLRDPALDEAFRTVDHEVETEVDKLPENLRALWRADPRRTRRRGPGLAVYLPFWLDASFASGRRRLEAHRMAVANRFGQLFCLLQDGVLDQDPGSSPALLLPLNMLFLWFIRGYQAIFPADHPFWNYFERYWQEYLEALAWEKRLHERPLAYSPGDLRWLGRKCSPFKICGAGMAFVAESLQRLPDLEATVETLHAGYQLLDDLRDWREDLARGHWTWPLTLARERVPRGAEADAIEEASLGDEVAVAVLETAVESLEEARRLAGPLQLPVLEDWLDRLIRNAWQAICETSRPHPLAALHALL